jgi:hypothetical protein
LDSANSEARTDDTREPEMFGTNSLAPNGAGYAVSVFGPDHREHRGGYQPCNSIFSLQYPRRLPTIRFNGKEHYFDYRLSQFRNVDNPHEFVDLTPEEREELSLLARDNELATKRRGLSERSRGYSEQRMKNQDGR